MAGAGGLQKDGRVAGKLLVEADAIATALDSLHDVRLFIALATWRLLENDGALLKGLRGNPSITNTQVVDESLRFDSSLSLSDRYAVAATTIGGVQLAKDDRVTLAGSSANHDPAEFGADADAINFRRGKGPGWAFGAAGTRNCLGRAMVYIVMEPMIQTLRDAVPEPRLAAGFKPAWDTPTGGAMFRAMAELRVHC